MEEIDNHIGSSIIKAVQYGIETHEAFAGLMASLSSSTTDPTVIQAVEEMKYKIQKLNLQIQALQQLIDDLTDTPLSDEGRESFAKQFTSTLKPLGITTIYAAYGPEYFTSVTKTVRQIICQCLLLECEERKVEALSVWEKYAAQGV